jgi:flagellar biosynthesis/type III secretory pathway M-ring protein FliF/YscJ
MLLSVKNYNYDLLHQASDLLPVPNVFDLWSFPVNCWILFEHLSVSETAKITSDLKHFEGPFRQESKQRIQVLQVAKVPKVRHLTFHRGFKTARSDGFFGKFSCSCTKS